MPDPLLAVIIPVHDGQATIRRAVESVLAQSGVDLEVVVVDDGSSDDSAAAAADAGDDRVRVLRQRQGGTAVARNAGVAVSEAPIIAFLDADDEALPGWAEALTGAMAEPGIALASVGLRRRQPDGSESVLAPRPLGPAYCGITAQFLAGAFAVRRSLFDEVGGYRVDLRFGENFELGLRLAKSLAGAGLAAAVDGRPLAIWNTSEGRSYHPEILLASAEGLLAAHGDSLAADPKLLADHHAVAGVNAARLGDSRRARRHFLAAVRARPTVTALGRLAVAVLPPLRRRTWAPTRSALPRLPPPSMPITAGRLPRASVVIACYDGGDLLLEQVKAVAEQLGDGESELILADNGSTDGSVAAVAGLDLPHVRVVAATGRRGQGHARNVGATAGRYDVVVFLDQDDLVRTGYLDAMRRALAQRPFVAARMAVDRLNDPVTARSRTPTQVAKLGEGLFPWAYGSTLGIHRPLFEAVGGFDETLVNGEDVDLCFRLQERFAVELALVDDAVLDYRLRSGWRTLFRQGRTYGRSGPEVYLRHRRYGLRRDPLRRVLRLWAGLARQTMSKDRGRRWEAAFVIGARLGRLEGSVKRRVWYP